MGRRLEDIKRLPSLSTKKLTIRQYLRLLDKKTLDKLFILSELTEEEYWLLTYAYIQKRMVENTCIKLNIGKTTYHSMLNVALTKVSIKLKEINKIRIFE